MRFLCRLGIHKWSVWMRTVWGNKVTRQCLRCFRIEDKRLF